MGRPLTHFEVAVRNLEEAASFYVVEPMPIPGVGSFAMFQVPDGS